MPAPRILLLALVLAAAPAAAQTSSAPPPSGDPAAGRAIAEALCARCHALAAGEPRREAASFPRIAAQPSITAMSLNAILQTAHRDMPAIKLTPAELADTIAFILSLKYP